MIDLSRLSTVLSLSRSSRLLLNPIAQVCAVFASTAAYPAAACDAHSAAAAASTAAPSTSAEPQGPGLTAAGSSTGKTPPDINESRGSSSPRHATGGSLPKIEPQTFCAALTCSPAGVASNPGCSGAEVYVSARNPHAHHLTPRTRTLYAFSDTPAGSGADRQHGGPAAALRDFNVNINGAPGGGGSSQVAANALAALSTTAASTSGAPTAVAASSPTVSVSAAVADANGEAFGGRRVLGGDGGGVMASGNKRARAVFEPSQRSRASSSAADDEEEEEDAAEQG